MAFPTFVKVAVVGLALHPGYLTPLKTDETLTETMARAVGFSYEMVPSQAGFGYRQSNGNWTGMLGMLQSRDVDMVVSTVAITEERNEDFLFTYPFTSSEISFITGKHQHIPDMSVVLHPFSTQLWIAVIICLCTMPFFFRALLSKKYPPMELLMAALGSVLQQGTKFNPKRTSEYLLLVFWFLGAGFVCYTYTAVLLSFITFPSLKGIRTIKDLSEGVERGEYRCKAFRAFLSTEMLRSKDPSLRIIGRNLKESGTTPDFIGFLEDHTKGWKPVFIDQQKVCRQYKDYYFTSDDVFFTMFPAIAMRKDFCCKSKMDEVIHRFWAAGAFQKLISDSLFHVFRYYMSMNFDWKQPELLRKLSVADLKGPFAFLIASHIFAFCVFLVEMCIGKSKK